MPDVDSLASPAGIFGALQTLAGLDCMAAIDAHCPDTYIAWMQATDPGNSRAAPRMPRLQERCKPSPDGFAPPQANEIPGYRSFARRSFQSGR